MFKNFFIFIILTFFCLSNVVYADGMVIPKEGNYYTKEADQKAVIFFKNDREDLYLSVGTKGNADDFAWIVPTPSKPDINEAPPGLFDDLSKKTQPKDKLYEIIADLLDIKDSRYKHGTAISVVGEGSTQKYTRDTVRVVEQKYSVGMYDTATLKAEKARDLYEWLGNNGYDIPEGGSAVLQEYIAKDWYFVAMKISDAYKADHEIEIKNIKPIKISFDTNKIIFPLKISSIETSSRNSLLAQIEDIIFTGIPSFPEEMLPSDSWIAAGIPESKVNEWKGKYEQYEKTNDSSDLKKSIHETVSSLSSQGVEKLKETHDVISDFSDSNRMDILFYVFASHRTDIMNYSGSTDYASKMSKNSIAKISTDSRWSPAKGDFFLTKVRMSLSKKDMLKDAVFGEASDQTAKNDGSMSFGEWIFTLLLIICILLYFPVAILTYIPWGLPVLYLFYLASFIALVIKQFKSNNKSNIKKFLLEVYLGSMIYFPFIVFGGIMLIEASDFYLDWQVDFEPLFLSIAAILSLMLSIATAFLIHKLHIKVIYKREQDKMQRRKQEEEIIGLRAEINDLKNQIDNKDNK